MATVEHTCSHCGATYDLPESGAPYPIPWYCPRCWGKLDDEE